MSVIAETSGGASCIVPLDGVADVAGLVEAVYAALELPEGAEEQYDAAVCDADGEETALEWDSEAALGEVGICGCEERVVLRVKMEHVARAKLLKMGVDIDRGHDVKRALEGWLDEDDDEGTGAAGEGLRLLVVAGAEMLESTMLPAVQEGDVGVVEKLLRAGYPVDGVTVEPLALATDAAMATLLLDNKAQVNAVDAEGRTPLCAAAYADCVDVMDILLKRGADPELGNFEDLEVPLVAVVENCSRAALESLLNNGLNLKTTPSSAYAVYLSHYASPEMIEPLAAHGADINGTSGPMPALYYAIASRSAAALESMLAHGADITVRQAASNTTMLMCAVDRYWYDGVKRLIDEVEEPLRGAFANEADARGRTALITAIDHNKYIRKDRVMAMVTLLLETGADPNAVDREGASALAYAAGWGSLQLVELLLRHGARIDATNILASKALDCANFNILSLLLDAGADPNVRRAGGTTALMSAVHGGRVSAIMLLLRHGADINARDDSGRTALAHAAELGFTGVVQVLLSWGKQKEGGTGSPSQSRSRSRSPLREE